MTDDNKVPSLVKSFDIAMFHVSPRLWVINVNGQLYTFTNKKKAETFYRMVMR